MLDSHPQLIVFPEETKFFRRVLPSTDGLGPEDATRLVGDRILQVFQWSADRPSRTQTGFLDRDYSHLDYQQILDSYGRHAAEAGGDGGLLAAAILAYGDVSGRLNSGTRRWVEKSPYNERYTGRIFTWWPEARCLHVVRDPRDNYASYRRKHHDWSAATFAFSWRESIRRGWANQKRFGAKRYRILRYEDLALHPDQVIADIVAFLGIEEEPSLRSPTRDGRAWGGNSMFGETFEGISRSPVGRYRQDLEEWSCRELEKRLAPEMARLGYPLTTPLRPAERLAGGIARVKWRVRSIWPRPRTTRPDLLAAPVERVDGASGQDAGWTGGAAR
jgi:hypothetical protein